MTCSIEGCKRPIYNKVRALCNPCYQSFLRNRDKRQCTIPGCTNKLYARGWCSNHHLHWKRMGDPLTPFPPHPSQQPRPRVPCRVNPCPYDVCETSEHGLCDLHYSRWYQGIALDAPITPGKRGRKPSIPGIPQAWRSAATRVSYAYARKVAPDPKDRVLASFYWNKVREHRRTDPTWRAKWGNWVGSR